MTKDEVRIQLSAYLDGELGDAERRAVEEALAADAGLRHELDALRRTIELVRSLPRLSAPPGLGQRVLDAIHAPRPRRRAGWRIAALAAAASVLLAIAAALLLRPDPARQAARHVSTAPTPTRPEARDDKAAAPAEPDDARRLGRAADEALEELDATKDMAALADPDAAEGARHRARSLAEPGSAAGYVAAPADGRGGAGRAPGEALFLRKAGERAAAQDHPEAGELRKELHARAPAAAKLAAPLAETARTDAAALERQKASKALAEDKKAEAEHPEGLGQTAAWGSLERERRNLLAAIERTPPHAEAELRAREARDLTPAAQRPGPPTPPVRRGIGAPPALAANAVDRGQAELRLTYTDLARCLDEVQEILDGAALAYTVQPVGGGEFVVETSLPAPEARALVARLTSALMKAKREEKDQALAGGFAGKAEKADGLGQARRAEAPTVRLVLRFARAEGQAPSSPAAPAEPAPPSPAQK